MIRTAIAERLQEALHRLGWEVAAEWNIESPHKARFGHYATNAAFLAAKGRGENPMALAEQLASALQSRADLFAGVEPAPPGFVNFRLRSDVMTAELEKLVARAEAYARDDVGKGERVLVEFVSANPTGPLHVGNGRGGAIGDVLASLLSFEGYRAEREYYVNDARTGSQMEKLGISFRARCLQVAGKEATLPEEAYQGEYLLDIARKLPFEQLQSLIERNGVEPFLETARDEILAWQMRELQAFGIRYDRLVHEEELLRAGKVEEVLELLRQESALAEREGAVWFKASAFGGEKDEVLIRQSGKPTYFATDIAYHNDKGARADRLVDIWGADHHGHIQRLKSALKATGHDPGRLTVLLYQLVNLTRGGKAVKMSKRYGELVTLGELVEEVGRDAARFFFLMRDPNTTLDFDIELAKKQSLDNPVYYVQYAHTRVASIEKKAREKGFIPGGIHPKWAGALQEAEEELLAELLRLPEVLSDAAKSLEIHRLPAYATSLASKFHRFYQQHSVLDAAQETASSRYVLCQGVKAGLAVLLKIMGLTAPEAM